MAEGNITAGFSAGSDDRTEHHIIEALARSFSYTAYIDLATMTFQEIAGPDYATAQIGRQGSAVRGFELYLDLMVEQEYRDAMKGFVDTSTLKERLAQRNTISMEYVSPFLGWCRGIFSVAGRNDAGEPVGVVFCLQSIAGEKTRESELLTTISDFSEKAYFDQVTGVRNRRYFEEQKSYLSLRCAAAMVDIDDFKEINEAYGTSAGDAVLSQAAREILSCLGPDDVVVRHGDDDFVICFSQSPEEEICRRLEKIRRSVETMHIARYPAIHTTVSIGCAFKNGSKNIFLSADKMLYRAKQTKNLVAI